MTVLAFDTCFGACSAALWSPAEKRVLASKFEAMDKGHSERLVPMIGEVLAEAGCTLDAVATLAVTVGPGSFTGVRTGLAVARALALARGIAVRGTTSLAVMAAGLRQAGEARPVAIAVATRDGLVYFQVFDDPCDFGAQQASLATTEEAVRAMGSRSHVLAGTGAGLVRDAAAGCGVSHSLGAGQAEVRADVLARMACDLPLLNPPEPLYLREPDAKPQTGSSSFILPARP